LRFICLLAKDFFMLSIKALIEDLGVFERNRVSKTSTEMC
jgi:hypothetical protein